MGLGMKYFYSGVSPCLLYSSLFVKHWRAEVLPLIFKFFDPFLFTESPEHGGREEPRPPQEDLHPEPGDHPQVV